jgi:hypothetical protein
LPKNLRNHIINGFYLPYLRINFHTLERVFECASVDPARAQWARQITAETEGGAHASPRIGARLDGGFISTVAKRLEPDAIEGSAAIDPSALYRSGSRYKFEMPISEMTEKEKALAAATGVTILSNMRELPHLAKRLVVLARGSRRDSVMPQLLGMLPFGQAGNPSSERSCRGTTWRY